MTVLLVALGLLVLSGLLALVAERRPLLCTIIGAGGAVAGSLLGLVPVLNGLLTGTSESLDLPWDVPYGSFSVELDPLSAFFATPILVLCSLAAIYGSAYLYDSRSHRSLGPPWFLFNLLTASMVLVVLARNGMLFLTAWEIMSLASFFLVTFEDDQDSVRAAGRTYLIATHLGTAFLLVFFILLSQSSDSLDFPVPGTVPAASAGLLFVLALVGFGTKAGLMPFHVWLPEAHPAAPSHVSAVMSGVMIKTGIYGLVRAFTFLPVPADWWGWTLIGIGIVSGVWGILFALAQHDLKRMLAYSTVENAGIIAMGLGLGVLGLSRGQTFPAVLGFAGALLHVINHALFKGLLFLGAGTVLRATGTRELDRLGGLAKRMPGVAIAFLIGAAAITGVPPFNGFVSEFLLYLGAFVFQRVPDALPAAAALGVIAALGLIGGLAAIGFTKVFGIAFLGTPRSPEAAGAHAPSVLLSGPLFVLAAGCVVLGLLARYVGAMLPPVLAPLLHVEPVMLAPDVEAALAPLARVTFAAALLIAVALALALLRLRLLSGRMVTMSETWGCGYAQPTPRMQYTASSFVQPVLDFFHPLLHARKTTAPPEGPFPSAAALATQTPDLPREYFYRPLFEWIEWLLSRLRWLQHGNVHLYVLYIGVTLVGLLLWYVTVKPG
jgi:formate hydrogenlyase subunit 3/multisubunit Na+/H+ antiporter MnhD subunit